MPYFPPRCNFSETTLAYYHTVYAQQTQAILVIVTNVPLNHIE